MHPHILTTSTFNFLLLHLFTLSLSSSLPQRQQNPLTPSIKPKPNPNPNPNTITTHTKSAIHTLQKWYNPTTGLWSTTGWWNAANIITTLADFTTLDSSLNNITYPLFQNTYQKAQLANLEVEKIMTPAGLRSSRTSINNTSSTGVDGKGFLGFINEYYDDEGWWALAWLSIHTLTKTNNHTTTAYLDTAISLFSDMEKGRNEHCNGGIFWNKQHTYTGAIENELFFTLAASLSNIIAITPSRRKSYLDIATKQLDWFIGTGMLNEHNLINNGVDAENCGNDGGEVWTYNQGVILGGLVELWKATAVQGYLELAETIALAAIQHLTDDDGILHEPCEPDCGADGGQFKGIFVRYLYTLWKAGREAGRAGGRVGGRGARDVGMYEKFSKFIIRNAESIWGNARGDGDRLDLVWSGPFDMNRADACTQASALDVLVAGMAVENAG